MCETHGMATFVACGGELTRLSTFPSAWLGFDHYPVAIRCRMR